MKKLITIATLALAAAACGGSSGTTAPSLTTSAAINAYLDGKTMVMSGANIPSYPNGFNSNINYGSATQCYNESTIAIVSGTWNVTSKLGTLNGAATTGATGTCDETTATTTSSFSSTAVAITNVQGDATCFDVSVTYSGFAQEGRGKISADGKTVTLELFFTGQSTGATCEAGAVGSSTVTLNGAAFTGNAQQVYVIQ